MYELQQPISVLVNPSASRPPTGGDADDANERKTVFAGPYRFPKTLYEQSSELEDQKPHQRHALARTLMTRKKEKPRLPNRFVSSKHSTGRPPNSKISVLRASVTLIGLRACADADDVNGKINRVHRTTSSPQNTLRAVSECMISILRTSVTLIGL